MRHTKLRSKKLNKPEAETVGAERTKVGALQLSSEGHTSRGELRSTEKPLRDLGVD